jgi:hypothetical protein
MGSLATYDPYDLTVRQNYDFSSALTWFGRPWQWLVGMLQHMYHRFILSALARVYVHGPSIAGFGFWQGRTPEQVCAHLTVSNEDFWRKNMDECHLIVSRHFASWVVLLEFVVYAVLLWKVLQGLMNGCHWLSFLLQQSRPRK